MPAKTDLQVVISAVDKTKGVFGKIGKDMDTMGKKMTAVGKQMTLKVTAPIAALGAISVKTAADFDKAMTQSLAIMSATIEQEKEMKQVARDVAKSTTFSHKEAADAYFYLASAGLDATQSIAAMPKVAEFAQAGAFDLALATDLLTDAQSALGLTIRDDAVANMENMVRVSDTLVKANTLANATVQQFSESLTTRAGAALKMVNKDIEEGVAVLAAFADQGIKGAEAGTRLDIVLRDLQTRAIKNADTFAELGVTVFDTDGNMRNMADIIADLEKLLGGMSDEQKRATLMQMEFQDRSVASILALVGLSDNIRQYEKDLRKAGGTTKSVADKQLQAFSNQMEIIKSQLADVGVTIGGILMPFIEKLAEYTKDLASKFQELSPFMQSVVLVMAGIVAVVGPLLIVFGTLVKAIAALFTPVGMIVAAIGLFITQLVLMGTQMKRSYDEAKKYLGPLVPFFKDLWDKIISIFNIVLEFFKTWGSKVVEFFKFWGEVVWDAIKTVFTNIGNFLKGAVLIWAKVLEPVWVPLITVTDAMKSWLEETLESMRDFFIRIWTEVKDLLSPIASAIKILLVENIEKAINAIKKAINLLKPIWETGWNAMKGAVSRAWDNISGPVNSIIGILRRLRDMAGEAWDALKWGAGLVAGVGRGSEIPLQEGGIITKPTRALLGEAGPEMVIPLRKTVRAGISGGITVNILGGTYLSEEVAEEIGDRIIDKLRTHIRF